MKIKELPKILTHSATPEPVEMGCCLRSCGGKPSPANTKERKGSNLTLQKIKEAVSH